SRQAAESGGRTQDPGVRGGRGREAGHEVEGVGRRGDGEGSHALLRVRRREHLDELHRTARVGVHLGEDPEMMSRQRGCSDEQANDGGENGESICHLASPRVSSAWAVEEVANSATSTSLYLSPCCKKKNRQSLVIRNRGPHDLAGRGSATDQRIRG